MFCNVNNLIVRTPLVPIIWGKSGSTAHRSRESAWWSSSGINRRGLFLSKPLSNNTGRKFQNTKIHHFLQQFVILSMLYVRKTRWKGKGSGTAATAEEAVSHVIFEASEGSGEPEWATETGGAQWERVDGGRAEASNCHTPKSLREAAHGARLSAGVSQPLPRCSAPSSTK